MGSTLQLNNPTVVAAFHSALIHQGIIALLIFFLLAMLWVSVREWVPGSRTSFRPPAADLPAEPRGRRLIRARLKKVWRRYGLEAQILPAGGMIGHSDIAYVIDRSGRTRTELNFDPGPGTSSTQASFAGELSAAAQQNLGSS